VLLYQTLVGLAAWPSDETEYAAFKKRISLYLKGAEEAKSNTSWINPHADYEDSVSPFIDAILAISATTVS